jgi:hypothetical protein
MLLLKQPCRQFSRQCKEFNGTLSGEVVVQVAAQVVVQEVHLVVVQEVAALAAAQEVVEHNQ